MSAPLSSTELYSAGQQFAVPESNPLVWYPHLVGSIFAPFQGSTYMSIAVEVTARAVTAVVLLVLPAIALYQIYRAFTAKPNPDKVLPLPSPSSPQGVTPSQPIDPRLKALQHFADGSEPENLLGRVSLYR